MNSRTARAAVAASAFGILVVVIEFPTEQQAARFEQYLKTGSGRAFAKRHLRSRQERGGLTLHSLG